MNSKFKNFGCLFVSILFICTFSKIGFGRTLSLQQMDSIVGTACCSKTTENTDCKPSDLDTCTSCIASTSTPGNCPTSGQLFSGSTYDRCDTAGTTSTCSSNGNENCKRQYDCTSAPIVNQKSCDGDSCSTDNVNYYCRPCTRGEATSEWTTKPDEICS